MPGLNPHGLTILEGQTDVRVIELGCGPCFSDKAALGLFGPGSCWGQQLDGDFVIKLRILGQINFTHENLLVTLHTETRIVLNTGIRPPKEVLAIKEEHVNLGDEAPYCKVEQVM